MEDIDERQRSSSNTGDVRDEAHNEQDNDDDAMVTPFSENHIINGFATVILCL